MDGRLSGHKEQLRTMYISQNQTLEAVMKYMEQNHQLIVEKVVYLRLFKTWGFRKNKRSQDWEFVDRSLKKRKNEGKESQVFHNGMLLSEKQVKKDIARNVTISQQLRYESAPSPGTPEGFSVVTPPTFVFAELPEILHRRDYEAHESFHLMSLIGSFLFAGELRGVGIFELTESELVTSKKLSQVLLDYLLQKEEADLFFGEKKSGFSIVGAKGIVVRTRSHGARAEFKFSSHNVFADILGWALDPDSSSNDISRIREWAMLQPGEVFDLALFVATIFGHLNVVSSLLSSGTSVDSVTWEGVTPLHIAAEKNLPKIVEFLLSQGAQVNLEDKYGKTAWTRIRFLSSHDEVAQLLLKHGTDRTHFTARCLVSVERIMHLGDVESLRTGLRRGVDPSLRLSSRHSLLEKAILKRNLEMVTLLVQGGAILEPYSNCYQTLFESVNNPNDEAAKHMSDLLHRHSAFFTRKTKKIASLRHQHSETSSDENFGTLNLMSMSPSSDIYAKGSGPPRESFMGCHLQSVTPSPALSQISLSIGSLFGNGGSLPPITIPSPASSYRNRESRLLDPRSLSMPHPKW